MLRLDRFSDVCRRIKISTKPCNWLPHPGMFSVTLTETLGLNVAYPRILTLTFYKNRILEDVFILAKIKVWSKTRSYGFLLCDCWANGQGSDQMFLLEKLSIGNSCLKQGIKELGERVIETGKPLQIHIILGILWIRSWRDFIYRSEHWGTNKLFQQIAVPSAPHTLPDPALLLWSGSAGILLYSHKGVLTFMKSESFRWLTDSFS